MNVQKTSANNFWTCRPFTWDAGNQKKTLSSDEKALIIGMTILVGYFTFGIGSVFAFFGFAKVLRERNIKKLSEQETPLQKLKDKVLDKSKNNVTVNTKVEQKALDVNQRIDQIDQKFLHYQSQTPANFQDKCKALEEMYQEIEELVKLAPEYSSRKMLRSYRAIVVIHYARAHYPDFSVCKNLYLYAITNSLRNNNENAAKLLPKVYPTLAEIKKEDFTALENFVLNEGREFILNTAVKEDTKYLMANSYRFLGHCYQNIDRYSKPENEEQRKESIELFKKVYSTSETLLKDFKTGSEGYKELTELYYNSGPFMYWLKTPNDIDGKVEIYDDLVLTRDSSEPMQARVFNMKSMIAHDSGNLDEAIKWAERSFEIRSRLSQNDPFLLANLKNNLAKLYLTAHPDQLDRPAKLIKEAVEYAKREIELENSHPYFAFYYQGKAELMIKKDKLFKAETKMEKALQILENFKNSYKDTYNKYVLLLVEIWDRQKGSLKDLEA